MSPPFITTNVFDSVNHIASTNKHKHFRQDFTRPWNALHSNDLANPVIEAGSQDNFNKSNSSIPYGHSVLPIPEKPKHHVCSICARGFSRREHLSRHALSHTKEKPFECETCGRRFARRDLVLRHQQKVHILPTSAFKRRNEQHTDLNNSIDGRSGQSIISQPNYALSASEGSGPAKGFAAANTIHHTEHSARAPPISHVAGNKPSNCYDSMLVSLPNAKNNKSLDTAATLILQKGATELDLLQEGNQGTTPSFEDFESDLDHLFLDPYPTFNLGHHQPNDSAQFLTMEDTTSPQHRSVRGEFADKVVTRDASDLNWTNDSHTRMITTEIAEPAIEGAYASVFHNTIAGRYGEDFLEISNNRAQISHERIQPTSTLQAQAVVSSLTDIDSQAFQDTAPYTLSPSLGVSSEQSQNHLKLKSAPETSSVNNDSRSSNETTPPSLHENKYPVILKIIYGLKTHSTLLKLRENTRSSIEKQAKDYIYANHQQSAGLSRRWTSQLLSVVVKEQDTDISGYEEDDLTFLLELISQHDLSQFTVKVSWTAV